MGRAPQLRRLDALFQQGGIPASSLDPEQPPTTWQELLEVGQALTRPPEQYGLALLGNPDEGLVASIDAFIYSNGGGVVDTDTHSVLIDQPEAVEALEFYRALTAIAPPGTERRGEEEAAELFSTGQTAMALLGFFVPYEFERGLYARLSRHPE